MYLKCHYFLFTLDILSFTPDIISRANTIIDNNIFLSIYKNILQYSYLEISSLRYLRDEAKLRRVDDRGKRQEGRRAEGVKSITNTQVPPGCRYLVAHSAGKLFTGLFKRNLLKLTDFISRRRSPWESHGIIH